MDDQQFLAEQFEQHRTHLRAVAYRMLGSITEADDAVQEAWLRLSRSDADAIENLAGWLTTVVSPRVPQRVALAHHAGARTRWTRTFPTRSSPSRARSIPKRRRCSPTRWASRCSWCSRRSPRRSGWRSCCTTRSRCRSTRWPRCSAGPPRRPASSPAAPGGAYAAATAPPDADVARQRAAVDAFFAAARAGDFEGLVALLDPDVVARSDGGRRRARALGGHERRGRGRRSGADVREPGRRPAPGVGERGRGRGGDHRWATAGDHGLHRRRRADRRHQRPGRPGPHRRARSRRLHRLSGSGGAAVPTTPPRSGSIAGPPRSPRTSARRAARPGARAARSAPRPGSTATRTRCPRRGSRRRRRRSPARAAARSGRRRVPAPRREGGRRGRRGRRGSCATRTRSTRGSRSAARRAGSTTWSGGRRSSGTRAAGTRPAPRRDRAASRASAAARPPPALTPAMPMRSGVDAQLGGVLERPAQAGVAVVERPGVGGLGGEAVLDRHPDAREGGAQRSKRASSIV